MTRKVALATLLFGVLLLCGCAAAVTMPSPSATRPEVTPPSVQGESVPFQAKYDRTDGYNSDVRYPIVTVLRTAQEAREYRPAAQKAVVGPTQSNDPQSYLKQYDDAYFQDHVLIVIELAEPSGSIRHKVTDVVRTADDAKVLIQRIHPDGAETADMAVWHVLVELSREGYAGDKAEVQTYE